ncbi:MAG: hypothetical protein GY811_27480 [Myxococcales bacterium]|nr:hypothetical protein [Myxococcales bacterium]
MNASVISNIYLHEVLDEWFAETVMPRMKGKHRIIRYADDAVLAPGLRTLSTSRMRRECTRSYLSVLGASA